MELLPVTQSSSSSSWYLPYFRFPYFGCFLYPCLCGDTSHAVCNRSRNARASNRYNNAPDHRTEHDTTTRDRFPVRSESAPSPHSYNVCNNHRYRACVVPRFGRSPAQGPHAPNLCRNAGNNHWAILPKYRIPHRGADGNPTNRPKHTDWNFR